MFYGARMTVCGYLTLVKKGRATLVLLNVTKRRTCHFLVYSILTWSTNCTISLRYVSISAVT